MRICGTVFAFVALVGSASGFTAEQLLLEIQRGASGSAEHVVVPLDSLEGLSIVTSGPISIQGSEDAGLFSALQRTVKKTSLAVVREIADGVRLLSSVKDGWTLLRLETPASAFRSAFRLTVPASIPSLRIRNSEGEVTVRNFSGSVDAETLGGHIRLDRVTGGVVARTGGGEIVLGDIGSQASAYSAGGSITAQRVDGPVHLETVGGNITLGEARGTVRATTGGGNIQMDRVRGGVSASTAHGVIQVDSATGEVVAQTRDGSIKVGRAGGVQAFSASGTIYLVGSEGPLKASTNMGDIVAKVPASARLASSDLYTGSGDITIYLSPKLALTVQAICGGPEGGRIISEFRDIPVYPWQGSGERRAQAGGVLNGGGPVLRLTARSGSIYIRRNSE